MNRFALRFSFLSSRRVDLGALLLATAGLGACDDGASATPAPSVALAAMNSDPGTYPQPPEATDCWLDADGDGVGGQKLAATVYDGICPSGTSPETPDCDDADPNLQETRACYADADGDGVGDSDARTDLCVATCADAGAYSNIPDSACPDSVLDADVDQWVTESLADSCILENREFTTSATTSCANTGTTAKPRHKETQLWQITIRPEQILMGQATGCYSKALPVVSGTYDSGTLADSDGVHFEGVTSNTPQETYYNVPSSSQVEVVVPFKASLETTTDWTSSKYDTVAASCSNDGAWVATTTSVGKPSTTPELETRLYKSVSYSDNDGCFYLDLRGGTTNPVTGHAVYGVGTAMSANIKTLATKTTDLTACGLVIDDATAHVPAFTVGVDADPLFGLGAGSYKCGYDEDFKSNASDTDLSTYCDEALATYKDGLIGAVEAKWETGAAKLVDGLERLTASILQMKDIAERTAADGSVKWTVTWTSVSYTSAGIVLKLSYVKDEKGNCK